MLTARYQFRYWIPALVVAAFLLANQQARLKRPALAERPWRESSPPLNTESPYSAAPRIIWNAEPLAVVAGNNAGCIQPVADIRAPAEAPATSNRYRPEAATVLCPLVAQPTNRAVEILERPVLQLAARPLPNIVVADDSYGESTSPATPVVNLPPTIEFAPARQLPPIPSLDRSDDETALAPVNELALQHVRRGFALGDRNAAFSARREFQEALAMICRAIDARHGLPPTAPESSSQALHRALVALREVDDFNPAVSPLANLDLAPTISVHRTPVCKETPSTSQTAATQSYLNYGREQLSLAVGKNRVASHAFAGLGKCSASDSNSQSQLLSMAKAMAYYQAALDADANNHLAANELGVLCGKFGEWNEAKRMLLLGLKTESDPATWKNLAVAHQQLGEFDLARKALAESARAQVSPRTNTVAGVAAAPTVQWVDAHSFGGPPEDAPGLPTRPRTSAPAARTPERSANKSWWTPWR